MKVAGLLAASTSFVLFPKRDGGTPLSIDPGHNHRSALYEFELQVILSSVEPARIIRTTTTLEDDTFGFLDFEPVESAFFVVVLS